MRTFTRRLRPLDNHSSWYTHDLRRLLLRAETDRSITRLRKQHLWDGHKLVSLNFVPRDQSICGDHGLRTVGAEGFVSSIVEKDYVTAPNLLAHLPLDPVCSPSFPIQARNPPHHRFEPQLTSDPKGSGSAPAKRGTKK